MMRKFIILTSLFLGTTQLMAIPAPPQFVIKAVFASEDFTAIVKNISFGAELSITARLVDLSANKSQEIVDLCYEAGAYSRSASVVELMITHPFYDEEDTLRQKSFAYYFATAGSADAIKACNYEPLIISP